MKELKEVLALRDQLHRKIVQLVTGSAAIAGEDLHVQLDHPVEACYREEDPTGNVILVNVLIQGVDGSTGKLLAETPEGNPRRMGYRDLTVEELARIYDYIESKLFTFKELIPC